MTILNQLSLILFMDKDSLKNFINTSPRRYKKYLIPKKNGNGFRTIAQPSKQVKSLQRYTLLLLNEYVKVHHAAHAYVEGKSIKTNAASHQCNNYLLKMDFKDFFHSITPNIFIKVLEQRKSNGTLDDEDKYVISHLFFWKLRGNSPLRLSIGAPTSPKISNTIMYDFDEDLSNYCTDLNVIYTRYADDLTFSAKDKESLKTIPTKINNLLQKHYSLKIKINRNKTVNCNKSMNRSITGIVLNNDNELSLGRKKKRMISSLVHKFSFSLLEQKEINYLNGILGHAAYIEPEFVKRLQQKYGHDVIDKIKKSINYP